MISPEVESPGFTAVAPTLGGVGALEGHGGPPWSDPPRTGPPGPAAFAPKERVKRGLSRQARMLFHHVSSVS